MKRKRNLWRAIHPYEHSWIIPILSQFLLTRYYRLYCNYHMSYMAILFTSRSKQLANWQTVFLVCICSASFPCQDKPFWTRWQESKYMEIGFQQSHCYPSWWTTVQNCTNKSFPSAFQELALHRIAHTRPRMSMSFMPAFFLFDIV